MKLALIMGSLMSIGCVRTETVAPPPRPEPSWPSIEVPPASRGASQVILDADVTARVTTVDGTVLCEATPCAFTTAPGRYRLSFQGLADPERQSSAELVVDRKTVVLNHVLGRTRPSPTQYSGMVVAALGITAMIIGATLAVDRDTSEETKRGGLWTIGAGFGVTVLGGIISLSLPSLHREGATTQWYPATAATGAAWTAKF